MMKENQKPSFLRRARHYSLYGLGFVLVAASVAGINVSAAAAPAIAQTFQAEGGNIVAGALVGVKQGSSRTVEASNNTRTANLVGVVAKDPLITLGGEATSVEVVKSGVTTALVSDINGEIKSGDKITASPIDGIGMKVTEPSIVVGTAQEGIGGDTAQRTIRDNKGNEKTVTIDQIPIDVSVTFYAAAEVQQELIPPFVQNVVNTIAGKPVSAVRIIASVMVLLLALISVVVLLYSSVKSSIISIGRNPLSEKAVNKGLIEIGITVIGILLLTFITVYLILVT